MPSQNHSGKVTTTGGKLIQGIDIKIIKDFWLKIKKKNHLLIICCLDIDKNFRIIYNKYRHCLIIERKSTSYRLIRRRTQLNIDFGCSLGYPIKLESL